MLGISRDHIGTCLWLLREISSSLRAGLGVTTTRGYEFCHFDWFFTGTSSPQRPQALRVGSWKGAAVVQGSQSHKMWTRLWVYRCIPWVVPACVRLAFKNYQQAGSKLFCLTGSSGRVPSKRFHIVGTWMTKIRRLRYCCRICQSPTPKSCRVKSFVSCVARLDRPTSHTCEGCGLWCLIRSSHMLASGCGTSAEKDWSTNSKSILLYYAHDSY